MNVNRLIIILTNCLIVTGLLLLGGCGGGGGSAPPSTFTLTVEAANVPAGTLLGAIHGVIAVPVGVDIRTSASGQAQDGLITASGTAATGSPQVIGNFNSLTRQLTFDVISPAAGFGNGECAVITFDITAATRVTATDFTIVSAQSKDYTTAATVPGVSLNLK